MQTLLTAILGLALACGQTVAQTGHSPEPPPEQDAKQANGPGRGQQQSLGRSQDPVFLAIDSDGNGEISAGEIDNALAALKKLDENDDGQLTAEELRPSVAPSRAQEPPSGSVGVSAPAREPEREVIYGEPIESGYVILEGRVLSSPYRLGRRGRDIFVNGERMAVLPGGRAPGGRQRQDARGPDPNRSIANLEHWLYEENVIIVFDERTRIVADCEEGAYFLRSLIQANSLEERIALAAASYYVDVSGSDGSNRIPTSRWREILVGFKVDDSLHASLEDWIAEYDEEDEDEDPAVHQRAPDRSAQRMYGLSVVGMVLVALSCGTLLTQRPEFGQRWSQRVQSEASLSLVRRALALIVALSVFDLACTLLATTKGGFLEINPVGGSMLHKPWALSTFKLSATFVVVGILWSLRRRAGSQQASWWLCLVLTLVTARWVAVQSLFFL